MLENKRLADVFIIILVEPKFYRDLILDSKDLNKKKFSYI